MNTVSGWVAVDSGALLSTSTPFPLVLDRSSECKIN